MSPTEIALYGKRLLPQLLDEYAQATPDRIYATISIPRPELPPLLRDVKILEIAHCVNFYANLIQKKFGRSQSFETICYIGIPDLRYAICFLGAIKCGYKTLFISPRNPVDTNVLLLDKTECSKLCHSTELATLAESINAMRQMETAEIPSMDEMIQTETNPYSYEETFEKHSKNPVVVFHSSGTTGPPKPIVMSHRCFATLDNDHNLAELPGRRKHDFTIWNFPTLSKFYSAFPPVHLAGFVSVAVIPLYVDTAIPVLGPWTKPPSASVLRDILSESQGDIRALFIPPSIAEQLLSDPSGPSLFKTIDFLCYAGGPLSNTTGNQLSTLTSLCQYYGSTETFQIQQLVPHPEDWAYMEWHPNCNVSMQLHDASKNLYEIVIFPDENTAVYHIYPEKKEYRTGDLFERHPSKETLWKFFGRVDDIIVLSNGQKLNPIPMEALLLENASIAGSVVIGQGHAQVGLLIEPREQDIDVEEKEKLVESIWPAIKGVNERSPAYGRIMRSHIIVGSKAFSRSAKGTVLRRQTIALYEDEISALYAEGNLTNAMTGLTLQSDFSLEELEVFVKSKVDALLPDTELTSKEDLFSAGLDSIKAVELLQQVQYGVSVNKTRLANDIIWQNPTIYALSQAVFNQLHPNHDSRTRPRDILASKKMATMIEKYTKDLQPSSTSSLNVILTGSTGAIGAYVLHGLLKDPKVSKVYCLDRSADAKTRLESGHASKFQNGILDNLDRVEFLHVELTKKCFNIPQEKFQELLDHVDMILHGAWRVDFNLILESFEQLIQGVRALVDFSLISKRSCRLVFFSSIASAQNFASTSGAIPESVLESESIASGLGYGGSKYVSERILATASERCGLPVTILRIGQVGGPITGSGVWPLQEWVPSLIQTSKTLSLLPTGDFKVDWIPIDSLADIILEIVLDTTDRAQMNVYNLVNPASIKWNVFLDRVRETLGAHVELVPFAEWVSKLEQYDSVDPCIRESMPALKMLAFFKGLAESPPNQSFETNKATIASKTLAALGPLKEEWVRIWMRQLRAAGGLRY